MKIWPLILLAFLSGCGFFNGEPIEPTDPKLTSKLGITANDWLAIRQLATDDRALVVKDVYKERFGAIDVELKNVSDQAEDQGGPIARFKKTGGVWVKLNDVQGFWAVGYTKK